MSYEQIYFKDGEYAPRSAWWAKKGALLDDKYQYHFKQTWSSYRYDPVPDIVPVPLSEETGKTLRGFSDGDTSGLFVLILSGLYILLYKYGNQDIIEINTPRFDFGNKGNEFAGKEVPLITIMDEEMSVKELIYSVQQTVTESYNLQEFPISDLTDKFRSDVFAFSPDLHESGIYPDKGLIVKIILTPSIRVELSGKGDFSTAFLKTLASSLNIIFSAFTSPDTLIKNLQWIKEAGAEEDSFVDLPLREQQAGSNTIHGLFEAQSVLTPDKIAIDGNRRKLTYFELNTEVNKLAFYLRKEYGIAKGEVIGVMMDRSEWLIISMLAIMKAGGTYLPVSPDDPEERISYILQDAAVKILLIKLDSFSKVSRFENISLVPVDSLLSLHLLDKYEDFKSDAIGDDEAYIIYTSGSTGKPKGVIVAHKAFTYVILAHVKIYDIVGNDCIPFFFTPSFDASLKQVFLSLFTGSTLLIPEKEELDDPALFIDFLKKKKATIANLSPAYLKTLDKQSLKEAVLTVITGGEAPDVNDALFFSRSINYFNAYGPTEASVCCTYHKVDPEISYGKSIPMGMPIDGMEILIMDKFSHPLPAGIIGEIGISGPGLAKGYLNNPGLTNEKFIPHPLGKHTRVYLTGDLGIRLPDGNIEYVGRKDNQIKIRGYRIELDEIKQNLLTHPLIGQAIVVKREDVNDDNCIVAYIVSEEKMDVNKVRSYLKQRIPTYMLPYFIIQMQEFPLTANGKVDEKALPKPVTTADNIISFTSPRNSLDEKIAEVWSQVLAKACIGIEDNFFEMGGSSLQVIKVFDRLNVLFPNCLKISEIFDNPTISLQSDLIAGKKKVDSDLVIDYTVISFQ